MIIPIEKFGKDHWSLLMYIETRIVDQSGLLKASDPHMNTYRYGPSVTNYPSRLTNNEIAPEGHDDWSCLEDLQAAHMVTYDEETEKVGLTDLGWANAAGLRRWKAEGKGIANFKAVKSDVHKFEVSPLPKFVVGQRVFVDRSKAVKAGYEFHTNYYGTITKIYGRTGIFDSGEGLHVLPVHFYEYTVQEYSGAEHREIPQRELSLVEDDGA